MQCTKKIQAGQLGIYRDEILNWAANVTQNDLEWTSSVPDTDGNIKRNIFNYQTIKRLYKLAIGSKPDSVIQALVHNQLIDAYAVWTKLPGFDSNGRQLFLDKAKKNVEANQSLVLYGLTKQPIVENQIVEQLTNELKTISPEKLQEYENNLQELNNLRTLRQVEQRVYEEKNALLVQQLNELQSMLIRKDNQLHTLGERFKQQLDNERKKYIQELELAVQDAKEAIRKYDINTIEYTQAKQLYEQRTNQIEQQIMQLKQEKEESVQKFTKLNDLFIALKQIVDEALRYFQEQNSTGRVSFFQYSSGPNFEVIAIKMFQYMVQVSSLITLYNRYA